MKRLKWGANRWLWRPIWLIAALLVVAGCGSTYQSLGREADCPFLAELNKQAAARPVETNRYPTQIGDGVIVNVAIHETGSGSPDRVVVFLHGVLSDHEAWRFVAADLGRDHRLLLIDLPGSGASDRPHPLDIEPNGYSPDALAERVLQALEQCLDGRDPQPRITFVAHSLGGAMVIRMMGNAHLYGRHEAMLARVDRMVLLAPVDVAVINPPPFFKQVAEVSALEVARGQWTGVLRERVAAVTRDSFVRSQWALREEADKRYEMITDRDSRRATQAIFAQAVPREDDGSLDWEQVEEIIADYTNVETPCLILWGARDETLPISMGYKLAALIPAAELKVVDDCRHSIHIERPVYCAEIIRGFTRTGSSAFVADLGRGGAR